MKNLTKLHKSVAPAALEPWLQITELLPHAFFSKWLCCFSEAGDHCHVLSKEVKSIATEMILNSCRAGRYSSRQQVPAMCFPAKEGTGSNNYTILKFITALIAFVLAQALKCEVWKWFKFQLSFLPELTESSCLEQHACICVLSSEVTGLLSASPLFWGMTQDSIFAFSC